MESERRIKCRFGNKSDQYMSGIELLDDDGYCYEFGFAWDDRQGCLCICNFGVHIEWEDMKGGWVLTNLIPDKLFPNQQKLKPSQVLQIMGMLINNDFDGKTFTAKEVSKIQKLAEKEYGQEP